MLDRTLNDQMQDEAGQHGRKLFVAKVVANDDPLGINRIKVTIEGKLEGSVDGLPWMAPLRLSPFGQGVGFGVYGTPPVGADVIVYLQDGDAEYGFYVAGYLGLSNKHAEFVDPAVYGFQDPSGTILVVNTRTNVMTFTHASGYMYSIAENGSYTTTVPGDRKEDVVGQFHITVGGNVTIESTGGNVVVKAGGNANLTASGTVTVSGSKINLNA